MKTNLNSPYAPPRDEYSSPSTKRRKLNLSSASGNSWEVSSGPSASSAEGVSRFAATNFEQSPFSEFQMSPYNLGRDWEFEDYTIDDFGSPLVLPNAPSGNFVIHSRREQPCRSERLQSLNSPGASPREGYSGPSTRRRELNSSSASGIEREVSPEFFNSSAEDVSRFAATSFGEARSPFSEFQMSPDSSGRHWQLENLDDFSLLSELPNPPSRDFVLHRRSRSFRERPQPFCPQFAPFRNADGGLKGPCRYKPTSSIEQLCPFLKNALEVQNTSRFQWRGKEFQIAIQNDPESTGQFNIFATIPENQPQVIRGKTNAEIGLKTFRDHCIMLEAGFPERVNNDSHLSVLTQYRDLLKLKIPVAKIYNEAEAANGCGFFLVEIVPYPFHADWAKGTPIRMLSRQQLIFLKQIKSMFKKTYDAKITPDLKPDNLRIRRAGHLAITDLRERALSKKELDINFRIMLRSFNCEEGDEIYTFLNPIPAR